MKKLLLTILTALTLHPVWAGSFEDAQVAVQREDYKTAFAILEPLAINGNTNAQGTLAFLYNAGWGVPQNHNEAAKWYRLAALQGHNGARIQLGSLYANGQGVVQDYAEAGKWFRLAAKENVNKAQFNLGVLYSLGKGVLQDYVKAHMWFNLSAINNNQDAVKARDDLAELFLTKEQLAEAQKLARDCLARNFKGCD